MPDMGRKKRQDDRDARQAARQGQQDTRRGQQDVRGDEQDVRGGEQDARRTEQDARRDEQDVRRDEQNVREGEQDIREDEQDVREGAQNVRGVEQDVRGSAQEVREGEQKDREQIILSAEGVNVDALAKVIIDLKKRIRNNFFIVLFLLLIVGLQMGFGTLDYRSRTDKNTHAIEEAAKSKKVVYRYLRGPRGAPGAGIPKTGLILICEPTGKTATQLKCVAAKPTTREIP